MKRNLLLSVFSLLVANLIVCGQTGTSVSSGRTRNANRDTNNVSEELRKQQLKVFEQHVLSRLLSSIKQMDEAGLRLSVRNQVLKFLSESGEESNSTIASRIAQEALTDLDEHVVEIPKPMDGYLLADLGVWLEKNEPGMVERLVKLKERVGIKDKSDLSSLFKMKNGAAQVAEKIRRQLEAGQEVDGLIFHLLELQSRQFSGIEPLLVRIVELAERNNTPSLESLDSIREIYLQPSHDKSLKVRFATLVIARTHPALLQDNSSRQAGYDLLTASLPLIRTVVPALYEKALAQALVLQAASPDREEVRKRRERLETSLDPIGDLLDEADRLRSVSERNELIAEAAQIARDEKKLVLALEIVGRLKYEGPSSDFWRGWTDQFLRDVANNALGIKDYELAAKSVRLIAAPLTKIEGLIVIAQRLKDAGDEDTSARLFTEAIKATESDFDAGEKARAFFMLSVAAARTGNPRAAELVESGIKVLNNMPSPDQDSDRPELRDRYVRNLGFATQPLIRSFQSLTTIDENRALGLVEQIQKADFKSFAMLGILLAVDRKLSA